MTLELKDIQEMIDKGQAKGQTTRERAADDILFYWITQWDDQILEDTQLQYRGEFNMLRKAGNQIISDLKANPVQVDFHPIDETRDDAAELVDGLYRATLRSNASVEAMQNAKMETVVCGVSAWKLANEYTTTNNGDTRQTIKRYPIYDANNTVVWDPKAKRIDKSDAKWCCILEKYTFDAYRELREELTGEDKGTPISLASPETSYVFPWVKQEEHIYVGEFFYQEKIKKTYYTVQDLFGNILTLDAEKTESIIDELEASGHSIIDEKVVDTYKVTRYLASGEMILEETEVAGTEIPVVPCYGHRAIVEGEEHYEGVTRLGKDPQRLRNFQLSYLADIVSRSPREKPIFTPEQIQGLEHMYEDGGSENNYPYMLQNSVSEGGKDLPFGPVGTMPAPQVPQALAASIGLTREAIEDVANPGIPQNIADPDLSGKAVYALQNRLDNQSMEYQNNFKFAARRDAMIWLSMAKVVYDVPTTLTIERFDGEKQKVQMMQMVMDEETMTPVVINDLGNAEFEVFADIGHSYSTQKEQQRDEIIKLVGLLPDNDPLKRALILEYTTLVDGVAMDNIREYARKELILSGIKEPETQKDFDLLQQAAASQDQPDPNMVLAEAEYLDGQAAVMDAQTRQAETQIKAFDAATRRQKVEVEAAETGVNINKKQVETVGQRIDNVLKLRQPVRV